MHGSSFATNLKTQENFCCANKPQKNAVDRATAFRFLSRNIALALSFELENNDPLQPELSHYFDPTRKQGGDNSDALYVGAPINGTDTYRVSGYRGSARYFAITVVERGDTPWGGAVAASLFGDDITVQDDGYFELIISPNPHPGNWIKSTPNTFRLTFRQFFSDWESEQPMKARIDRLSESTAVQTLSPDKVVDGLGGASKWLTESITYWADMIERWKSRPNEFLSYQQLDDNAIDATPGGVPLIAYWQLPEDEVLIVRVTPPKAKYWAVEFGNYWWETVDYRYRLANTNDHYAQLEDNGELIIVVSHQDPGVPNWLDPAGHSEGYITFRWIGADSCPIPQCQQIKADKLFASLPSDVKTIDNIERQQQLAARRRGVCNRFPY